MKQKLNTWIITLTFILISISAYAQNPPFKIPRWVSDRGYWVVESNINSPLNHIIRFYNNANELLYKETLQGVKLNAGKRKVKMKLKKVLEASVLAWEKKKDGLPPVEELALVKSIL